MPILIVLAGILYTIYRLVKYIYRKTKGSNAPPRRGILQRTWRKMFSLAYDEFGKSSQEEAQEEEEVDIPQHDLDTGYLGAPCAYEKAREGGTVRKARRGDYYTFGWLDRCAGCGWLPPSNYYVSVLPFTFDMKWFYREDVHWLVNRLDDPRAVLKHNEGLWSHNRPKVDSFLYDQWKNKEYALAMLEGDWCYFNIIPGEGEGVTYSQMEHFWTSLGILKHRVSFEIVANGLEDNIAFQFLCHRDDRDMVADLLRSIFPNVNPSGDDTDHVVSQFAYNYVDKEEEVSAKFRYHFPLEYTGFGVSFGLLSHYSIPIAVFTNFDRGGDPLTSLLSLMGSVLTGKNQGMLFQALVEPDDGRWASQLMRIDDADKSFLDEYEGFSLTQKTKSKLYGVCLRVVSYIYTGITGETSDGKPPEGASEFLANSFAEAVNWSKLFESQSNMLNWASTCKRKDDAAPDFFKNIDGKMDSEEVSAAIFRNTYRHGFILNAQELASICHFPSKSLEHPKLLRGEAGIAKAPASFIVSEAEALQPSTVAVNEDISEEEALDAWSESSNVEPESIPTAETRTLERSKGIVIGVNEVHRKKNRVYIPDDFRFRHIYIVGKSGTGKTTLLQNMILADIYGGKGVGVIDPHGDLIRDKILPLIPKERVDDVILFDPTDYEYPIGLNMFQVSSPLEMRQMKSDIVVAIRRLFQESSWGENIDNLFNSAVATLLADTSRTYTFPDLRRLINDEVFRSQVLSRLDDDYLKEFWTDDFPRFTSSTVSAMKRRLGSVISEPEVRNILGQRETTFSFREMMDSRKIFLANLSRGELGEDIARTFGGLLVSKIQLTAMARASQPEERRVPFYLYVDEFQNFVNESFEIILSEARKYKLCLTMAHQFTAQLPRKVSQAVFGNVGTIITFALGVDDASALEKELGIFSKDDIINLDRFQTFTRIGKAKDTFSMATLPPPRITGGNHSDLVRQRSREKYCTRLESRAVEGDKKEQPNGSPQAGDFLESADESEVNQQDTGEQGAGKPEAATPEESKDGISFLE